MFDYLSTNTSSFPALASDGKSSEQHLLAHVFECLFIFSGVSFWDFAIKVLIVVGGAALLAFLASLVIISIFYCLLICCGCTSDGN